MEFNELIDDFAKRHNVENLVAVDGAAALDIDGIIITIVAKGDILNFSAEIGEPPAEGAALFANLLLEANTQPDAFFAKIPDPGPYVIARRVPLSQVDDDVFDAMLEAFVNNAETWRRLLVDFRPAAKAAAESAAAESSSLVSSGFMPV